MKNNTNKLNYNTVIEAYKEIQNETPVTLEKWNEIESITEETAKNNAFYSCEICDGEYIAYFINTVPYYDVIAYIYSTETEQRINIYTTIHGYGTTEERVKQMLSSINQEIFATSDLLKPSKDYAEHERKRYFAANYYIKKFPGGVTAFYIGKPSEEQEKIFKNGYFSRLTFTYFEDKETAEKADRIVSQVNAIHAARLSSDMNYFKSTLIYEFYNHECKIGGGYETAAAAAGIFLSDMTPEQAEAYNEAKNNFLKEAYQY